MKNLLRKKSGTSVFAMEKNASSVIASHRELPRHGNPHGKKTIDHRIKAIHKSTRVLIPFFAKHHNFLRMKSRHYYNWHLNPYSTHTHYAILAAAFIFAIYFVAGSFSQSTEASVMSVVTSSETRLTTEVIDIAKDPDKFYLKNEETGQYDKAYEVEDTEDGTKIKTKSATEAGFQQLIVKGNESKLFDGDKLVAEASVKTEEKAENGDWQSVGIKKEVVLNNSNSSNGSLSYSSNGEASEKSNNSSRRSLEQYSSNGEASEKSVESSHQGSNNKFLTQKVSAEDAQTITKELKSSQVKDKSKDKVVVNNSTTLANGEELKVTAEIGMEDSSQPKASNNNDSDSSSNDDPSSYSSNGEASEKSKAPLKKQTFSLENKSKTTKRLYWEIQLKDFDIKEDSSTVVPDAVIPAQAGIQENKELDPRVKPEDDNLIQTRKQSYNSTIIDCSDYLGQMRWVENAETDTIKIYFDEEGTTEDIIIDPTLTVTEPVNQISVSDGTRTWVFDSSVAGAPQYFYDTRVGEGVDNLGATYGAYQRFGAGFQVSGELSSITQTIVENTATRVKIRTQGVYSTSPTAVDNTYTIYPDGRVFLQYSGTIADSTNIGVVQHRASADPEVHDFDSVNNTTVISDIENGNYAGLSTVPYTIEEFGGAGNYTYSCATHDRCALYRVRSAGDYSGNLVMDLSNYRATTTTRDALMNEYRTPATLASFTKGSQTGDGFNEAEGAYTIAADASGDAAFTLQPGSYPRIDPAFVLTGASRAAGAYRILVNGAPLINTVDYNLAKPDETTLTIQLLDTYSADSIIEISNGPNVRTISDAGGNWDSTSTWVEGVVPTTNDDIVATPTSGNLVLNVISYVRTFDLSAYRGELTVTSPLQANVGASTADCKFGPNMTFGTGSGTIRLNATTGGTMNFYTNGLVITKSMIINNTGGLGTVNMRDELVTGIDNNINLNSGILNTNNFNLTAGSLTIPAGTKTLNLGSSTVTLTKAGSNVYSVTNNNGFTLDAGTSHIIIAGAGSSMALGTATAVGKSFYNVTFQGGGDSSIIGGSGIAFNNLTYTGTDAKTDILQIGYNTYVINGNLTVNGNSVINRVLLTSDTLGTSQAITVNGLVVMSNVDLRDITGAGTANWDLSSITGGSGDCGGNVNISFPLAADQHWTSATGGNWSDATKWTSRVPLPQDNVYFDNAFDASQTVTSDMPRLGKSIDWTGTTGNPTWTKSIGSIVNGSVTLISEMRFTGSQLIYFQGRGEYFIKNNGNSYNGVNIQAPNGIYTLLDDLDTGVSGLYVTNGTFNANNFNVTCTVVLSNYSSTRSILMGSGTWTITGSASSVPRWDFRSTTNLTFDAGTSTIEMTRIQDGESGTLIFAGGDQAFNNFSITGGGTTPIIVQGSNTFNNFTVNTPKTVKFTAGTTQTINGNFTATGTSGSIITLQSTTAGQAATIAHAGNINTSFNSIQDITSTGGSWTAQFSTSVSNNNGIDFPSYKRVSNTGGNFSAGTTWDGGVVPEATDDIYADVSSGDLVINANSSIRSFNFTGYDNSLTLTGALTAVGSGTAAVDCRFGASMTITGASSIRLGSVTGAVINIYTNNLIIDALVFTGYTGGSMTMNLRDNFSMTSGKTLTHNYGTFNTNNFAMNIGKFSSSNTNTRAINLGSSNIALTGTGTVWTMSAVSNLTLDAGTSIITVSGADAGIQLNAKSLNDVIFTGGGTGTVEYSGSYNNLSFIGTDSKNDQLSISLTDKTINGTLTVTGNSATNRVLVASNTLGQARTITAANVSISNADFRDITGAGTANWNLSAVTGRSGDAGGNSGITFSEAATKYWVGGTGSWSETATHWALSSGGAPGAGNIPLPQDNVRFDGNSLTSGSKTVTNDMPRLGKDIDWTGVVDAASWVNGSASGNNVIYGSLTTATGMTLSGTSSGVYTYFEGRGTHIITSNGMTWGRRVGIQSLGGTYSLQDAFVNTQTMYVNNGTFDANDFDITALQFVSSNGNTRTINMGSGNFTVTGTSVVWNTGTTTNLTLNPESSTIIIGNTSDTAKTFTGGGLTYNNIVVTAGGAGVVSINGANTFNNLTINSPKTVTFPANTTTTINGTFTANGTSGNIVTLNSSSAGQAATIAHSGNIASSWNSIQDITSTGGSWGASFSTNVSGNTGITFPSFKRVSNAGGNFSAGTTWDGGVVPTSTDDIYADVSSGNLTIDVTSTIRSLNFSTYMGTLTVNTFFPVYGADNSEVDIKLGGTLAGSSVMRVYPSATGTINIYTNGLSLPFGIATGNFGGTVNLKDNLTMESDKTFTVIGGTFNTNNFTINIGKFSSSNSNTRTINLGSSEITLTGTGAIWDMSTSTGSTLDAGTSTITATGANAQIKLNGKTLNNVIFTGGGTSEVLYGGIYNNLTVTGTESKTDSLKISFSNQTINNGLTLNGNSATNRLLVYSDTLGESRTLTASNVSISNADFRDVTGAGTASWDLSAISGGSGDAGGNSGITFTPSQTNYWVGNGGSWSDVNHWANASGGLATSGRIPLPQDDVRFDTNSFSSANQTVTGDMPRAGRNFEFSGVVSSNTNIFFSLNAAMYGSISSSSVVDLSTGGNRLYLEGRGNHTIDVAGTLSGMLLNSFGGTYTLTRGLFTGNAGITFTTGTFDANDYSVTTQLNGSITCTGSLSRTIYMGNGTWSIGNSNGSSFNIGGSNYHIYSESSTILLPWVTTTNTRSFYGGGVSYNNIIIADSGSNPGPIFFRDSNTFNNMTIGAGRNIQFANATTQTINGTFTANGTSGSTISLRSSTAGEAATIAHAGSIASSWNSIQDVTSTGGSWTASFSTSVSNNNGITFPTFKRLSNAGGMFSAGATWDGGVAPTSSDDIYADATSGNLTTDVSAVVRSFDFTSYIYTLALGSSSLTATGENNLSVDCRLGSGMTITGTGTLRLSPTSTRTIDFYPNGLSIPVSMIINAGAGTGTANLRDNLLMPSDKTFTVTGGTFNTNNFAMNIGKFASNNSNSRSINLGSSEITITGTSATVWDISLATNLAFDAGTSTISFTGTDAEVVANTRTYNNVSFTGGGAMILRGDNTVFSNLSIAGTDSKTDSFKVGINSATNFTVNDTFTLSGNSSTNRLLLKGNTLGSANNVTVNGSIVASNVDFQDINALGAVNWDLSNITGGSGDCGGNSGIAFTPSATQTWNGETGSWSEAAKWTSRVPLPQDDVMVGAFGGISRTITADMPRMGGNIDFSGVTNNPTFAYQVGGPIFSLYGSLTYASDMSVSGNGRSLYFQGRGSHTINAADKSPTMTFRIESVGGSYTLNSDFSSSNSTIGVISGTFDANDFNVNCVSFSSTGSATRTINMGNGTWTQTQTGVSTPWNVSSTGMTLNAEGSTIQWTGSTQYTRTFAGGGLSYNNFIATDTAAGAHKTTITGNNTFNNLTHIGRSGLDRALKFANGSTNTFTGDFNVSGVSGTLMPISSVNAGQTATISKVSGTVILDYVSVQDIAVAGDSKWFLTNNSTSVSGNSGFITDNTAPTNPTSTTVNVEGTTIDNESWIKDTGAINFAFSGSTDGDGSGVAGYYTYFGTSNAPGGGAFGYQAHSGGMDVAQAYSDSISTADDGKYYYFIVKTQDAVGNVSAAATLFEFGYDKTIPNRPSFIAATPAGYTTTDSFSFSWPAGTDPVGGVSASGVKWYEYKRATALDETWSHTADASATVSGIQSYQEGPNAFFVRTVDNAGNISSTYQQVTYYYSGVAPAKPANLTVSPETSDTNNFTISWDKSGTGAGDPPVVGYYYSVNAIPTIENVTYIGSQVDHISIGPSPFATMQGLNTVYVLGVNAAGNLSFENDYVASKTFTAQTAAPPTPVNMSLSDSSNRIYETWSLTLKWTAPSNLDQSTFDHYAIERSMNGTDFSSLANTTSTAYIDVANLTNTATYFYRVKAVDNAGKESAASSIVHKQPTGNFLTPPEVLSDPAITNVKSSSATVTWTTNRESSSVVRYGRSDDGNFEASSGQFDSTVNHSVNLSGLAPSTRYYFQVQSLDEFRDYNADSAYSNTFSFTTAKAPAISETAVNNITLTTADISFETTTVSNSTIHYGETNSYGMEIEDISGASTTKHTVKLTSLKPGTTYHFRIKGADIENNPLISDDYQFDTLPLPKVENLKIEPVMGSAKSAFKASWTTNVPTSTIIRYSANGNDWQEAVKAKSEIGHSIEVSGLEDNTTYDIIVSGRDEIGNQVLSPTEKFTTPFDTRPPKISDLVIETSMIGSGAGIKAQIAVGWKTDEPTTAIIEYGDGTDGAYTQNTQEESSLLVERAMLVSDLKPSATYHLKVVVKDKAGNTTESENRVFVTNEGKKSAWDLVKGAMNNIFGFWLKEYE
ncbi:MAG: fibronectin type III domain-containing protein [Patescibacteria group bacterium]